MALSTEQANLILTINGTQAGNTLKDLRNQSRDLQRALEQTADPKEFARLTGELAKVNGKLKDIRQATSGVSAAMNDARTKTSGFSGILQSLIGNFLGGGLLGIVQSVVGGILSLGKTALKSSADLESLQTSVEVFLGSGKEATKFLKEIQKFAAETPFEFPELAEAGKKLLAFGYSGDEAIVLLKKLGDVAAATQVPIAELAAIVGKAKLGEKIQGEELNQLADRGINVFPQLAKILNTTTDNIKKLGSEGKISYADLEKAITMATEKGGQFNGMMAKQSQTFNGLMSTLTDNFNQFVGSLLGGVGEGLKPAIAAIGNFFGQLNDFIRDGKKPVGEYANVITHLATVLKILGAVFGYIWEVSKIVLGVFIEQVKAGAALGVAIGKVVVWFDNLLQQASKIPLIGGLFKPVSDAIGVVKDLLSNTSATFAGFRAAAAQAITNVQNYFKALIIDAEILRQKLVGALSLDKTARDNADKIVAALQSQKTKMFEAGKTVEKAYADGRNEAIAAQTKAENEADTQKKAAEKQKKALDEKALAKAAKERKKLLKDTYEAEIEELKQYWELESIINEKAFFDKKRTESDYAEQELILNTEKYKGLLRIQNDYLNLFKEGSKEYLDIRKAMLETERKLQETEAILNRPDITPVQRLNAVKALEPLATTKKEISINKQRNDDIDFKAASDEGVIQARFKNKLITEIEAENQIAKLRKDAANLRFEEAKQTQNQEYNNYLSALGRKIEADNHYHDTLRKNEKRTQEIKAEAEKIKMGLASESFAVAIDLLSKDEAARKKNAAAIRAFQIAQVVTDGVAEVQGIWKTANLNALNILFPGAGSIIAGVKTALAVGRTAAAINRIQSQKFARGGIAQMGVFGGQPHAAGGTNLYGDDGTQINVERDELFVVLNKRSTGMLQRLSDFNVLGGGVPFMESGGVLAMNTTPVVPIASGSSPVVNMDLNPLINRIDYLTKTVASQQTRLRAVLVRSELEEAAVSDLEDRAAAAV